MDRRRRRRGRCPAGRATVLAAIGRVGAVVGATGRGVANERRAAVSDDGRRCGARETLVRRGREIVPGSRSGRVSA